MNYRIVKGSLIILLFSFIAFFSQSCINRVDRTCIEGTLSGNPKSKIYFNRFDGDSLVLIDSVKTSRNGCFSIKLQSESPYFVTLGFDKVQTSIILLVQPGEELTVKAEKSDLSDYKLLGSNGSALIRELTLRLNQTKSQIDSFQSVYNTNLINPKKDSIYHLLDSAYSLLIEKHRNYTIGFIRNNSFSLASIMALFQMYDSAHPVLDYSNDRNLFRLVDSSLMSVYSTNCIVNSLHLKIQAYDSQYERTRKREMMFKEGELLPNVGYPLITGENLFVSGIWFKCILIDFWADWCVGCNDRNQQLREIYKEFGPKGLVVLQVSLGANPDSLKSKVLRDSLFWYHATIQNYFSSKILDTLKISSVPSSYITDRWGKIKAVNLEGDQLKLKLIELLR